MAFPTHFPHLASLPMYPINPNFVDVFNKITPVQDSLLAHLDIEDILMLRRVTKRLQDPFKIVQATQFNINSRLRFFFDDPIAFRNQQAQSGALIAGWVANEFLARENEKMKRGRICLSIIVHQASAKGIMDYFRSVGYAPAQDSTNESPRRRALVKVTSLSRTRNTDVPPRVIQFNEARWPPLYALLRGAMTTIATNFITWDKAYSTFPLSNVIKREAYVLENKNWRLSCRRSAALEFVKEFGFTMQSANKTTLTSSRGYMDTPVSLEHPVRRVGDKYTWMVQLNTAGIQPPNDAAMQTFLVESAEFHLEFSPSARPFSALKLKFETLESVSLRNQYIVRAQGSSRALYNDLSVMALEVLEPEDRPTNYDTFIGQDLEVHWNVLDGWQPPISWVYYDDEVIDGLRQKWPELQDPR